MANEMKAVCGGFLVGDGLTMDGKVLKASGSAGGCNFYTVEIHGDVPSWAGGGTIPFMSFVVATEDTFTNKEEFISYLEDEGYLYMVSTFRNGAYVDDDGGYTILNAYFVNTGDSGISVQIKCIQDSDSSVHSYDLPIYPDTIEIEITAKS